MWMEGEQRVIWGGGEADSRELFAALELASRSGVWSLSYLWAHML